MTGLDLISSNLEWDWMSLEHGSHDLITNVSNDDEIVTGKIALAHLNEFPDYYTRLQEMESKAKEEGSGNRNNNST